MESIVGGRSGIVQGAINSGQSTLSAATARLLDELKQASAEQTLLTLAALEYYERCLLDALLPGEKPAPRAARC
ncbi:MAG: hypothetical protein NZ749_07890 [bacterium]|nr:hypothetical protein [bacterium]